eukprot:Nitzschia sp. Nitz4//scaffold9_size221794//194557//194992//NITZ4_001380-RA/size221794-processed-gene-0.291-mRNA-1//1//CDS//3329561103//4973//frame0
MAQGNHKLAKAHKSSGSQKRKAVKNIKKTKKGHTKIDRTKDSQETSKAINRKNERIIAAKALSSGTTLTLSDIATRGKDESQRQLAARDKKQNKPTKLTQRLQVRLNKLK